MLAFAIIVSSISTLAYAQNYDEVISEIMSYQECFNGHSHGLQEDSYYVDGKVVKFNVSSTNYN